MIFVDTSFWVAFRNRRDRDHDAALRLMHEHGDANLATSNAVRGETWTFLNSRVGHDAAVHFLDVLESSSRFKLFWITPDVEERSAVWLRLHDERPYSFVDATSFMLMKDLRIGDALTFDEDFTAAGFRRLR